MFHPPLKYVEVIGQILGHTLLGTLFPRVFIHFIISKSYHNGWLAEIMGLGRVHQWKRRISAVYIDGIRLTIHI